MKQRKFNNYWLSDEQITNYVKSLQLLGKGNNLITEDDFVIDDFQDLLNRFQTLQNSEIYKNSKLPVNVNLSNYHCNRAALSKSFATLKKALEDIADVYISNLVTLSDLRVYEDLPDGHSMHSPLSSNALKSAVLLYCLACKYPFAKNDQERAKLDEKIKLAKTLHQNDLKEYIELHHNPSKYLYNHYENQCLDKYHYLGGLSRNKWIYSALGNINANATTIDEFLKLNNLNTLKDVSKFCKDSMGAVVNGKTYPKEYSIVSSLTTYELTNSQLWFKHNIKFPYDNKNFMANRPTPSFDHKAASELSTHIHWDI